MLGWGFWFLLGILWIPERKASPRQKKAEWATHLKIILGNQSAGRATCGLSRRCTEWSAADRRSVTETTMRAAEVIEVQPGLQVVVALQRVMPVAGVSPFAQGGLDKAFSFAVGARSVGAGEAVAEAELAVTAGRAPLIFRDHSISIAVEPRRAAARVS